MRWPAARIRHLAAAAGAALALAAAARLLGAGRASPRRCEALPELDYGPPRFARELDAEVFQKGNLHAHTLLSDGDSSPEVVYAWYRDHGYQFAVVTDHNQVTPVEAYRHLENERFLLLPGEEVTMTGAGRQVHVNSLCGREGIPPRSFTTAAEALTWAIAQIRAQGGVPLVNHPNFDWALTPADLEAARGASLLEIASGHPWVHQDGDAAHPSHEALWDIALGDGLRVMGVGVDDAHHLAERAPDPAARPGRAWVEVFSGALERAALCAALDRGDLYASTGPSIRRVQVTATRYKVWPVEADARVRFVGAGGRLLDVGAQCGRDGSASYRLRGHEGYVRARLERPDGGKAWTPAVRVFRAVGGDAPALPGSR